MPLGGVVGWAAWCDTVGDAGGWHYGVGTIAGGTTLGGITHGVGASGDLEGALWGQGIALLGYTGVPVLEHHQCQPMVHLSVHPPAELGRDALPLQAAADGAGAGVQ